MISKTPRQPLNTRTPPRTYPLKVTPSPGATTDLWNAVRSGCPMNTQKAIEKGASIHSRSPHGGLNPITPLDSAVLYDQPGVLSVLLQHGARLTRGRNGQTAAHAAAHMANSCVAVLEKAGRLGPLSPLAHDGRPPIAFVLGTTTGPIERRLALIGHWLSQPLAWTPATAAAVLEAAFDLHPPELLDRLMATGLQPHLLTGELNPLTRAIDRWSRASASPTMGPNGWLLALARAGVVWPEGMSLSRPNVAEAHAAYLEIRLNREVSRPVVAPSKPRL